MENKNLNYNETFIEENIKVDKCFKNNKFVATIVITKIENRDIIYYNFVNQRDKTRDFYCTKNEFIKWIKENNIEILK